MTALDAASLIDAFTAGEGFPEAAIAACLATPDAARPGLMAIVEDRANGGTGALSQHDTKGDACFVALHILAEQRATEAFQPLLRLLQSETQDLESLFGDAMTETMGPILIALNPGDFAALEAGIANRAADAFARDAMMVAWAHGVLAGAVSREHARGFLASFPDTVRPEPDSFLWGTYVAIAGDLGFADLAPVIDPLFTSGAIAMDEGGFRPADPEDFGHHLKAARLGAENEANHAAWLASNRFYPFEHTLDTLRDWSWDGDEAEWEEVPFLAAAEDETPFEKD
ncbi:DUF1186 domain-containing protein [Microvirga tunisiensis]|uniref:DUF1186 domain-containing protein n=1 Tax=Pannonibacter tanglangensis TaxID=2750084 RepID=A0A7X5JAA3_9HYPH|nr:DUF1186 domain-containing protein [Pannonibacter sp. XCT-53]NBN79231.1 DUF1186 domain-containing protein [Pannonibacter sp. XCT-53]